MWHSPGSELGRVNTTECFNDQSEMNKSDKHYIEFLEAREDAPEALEPAKQAFDFVTAAVHRAIVFPGVNAIALGRDHWHQAQFKRQLTRLIPFVGAVHQQIQRAVGRTESIQQCAAFGRIVCLAWRQCKRYGRSSIRGNHMNLGAPSSTRLADGLWAVFFNAPVPSGWTFTMVLSKDTASILMRMS